MPCFLANIGMMFAGMVTAMLALMSSGAGGLRFKPFNSF